MWKYSTKNLFTIAPKSNVFSSSDYVWLFHNDFLSNRYKFLWGRFYLGHSSLLIVDCFFLSGVTKHYIIFLASTEKGRRLFVDCGLFCENVESCLVLPIPLLAHFGFIAWFDSSLDCRFLCGILYALRCLLLLVRFWWLIVSA